MTDGELEDWLTGGFSWRDGPRLVRFAPGAAAEILGLLESERLASFALVTTPRAAAALPQAAAAARVVVHVPPGPVPEAGAEVERRLLGEGIVHESFSLLALGGGRVIDAAKAVAAAHRLEVAVVPTTLSGAEMTPLHRPLPDGRGASRVTPRLVVTDPELLTQPLPGLAATAMNAFGHAFEAFYLPGRSPVVAAAALMAARLLVNGLEAAEGERRALALGGLLAGYAIGSTGLGFHHALCQTVVRETGAPHAQVYAVLAPHSLRFMLSRAGPGLAPLVELLAGGSRDEAARERLTRDEAAVERVTALAARAGVAGLAALGVTAAQLPALARAAAQRAEVRRAVRRPSPDDLEDLLRRAL